MFQVLFRPFWLVSTPNFPNPPPNDKKRLKAPTGANQKNDTFWPVECQKNTNKNENQHRKPPSLRFPPASRRVEQVEWFGHLVTTRQRAEPLTWAFLWIGWQRF